MNGIAQGLISVETQHSYALRAAGLYEDFIQRVWVQQAKQQMWTTVAALPFAVEGFGFGTDCCNTFTVCCSFGLCLRRPVQAIPCNKF